MTNQQQYFWGCKLDTSRPEETWTPPESAESAGLRIIQVVLGEDPGQSRNVVKVRTKGYDDQEFDQAIFGLKLGGKNEQITTDLDFQGDTTFQLVSGTGPVYISGYQCFIARQAVSSNFLDSQDMVTTDMDDMTDGAMKRRHSESEDLSGVPKNMKLIKMTRANICNNIKMDPRNPEGLTDLWVGNIHPDASEDDLKELFGRFGRIVSCHVMPRKYCGFINYAQKESAGKAMGSLQNAKFMGVPLVIKFPEKRGAPQQQGGGMVGGGNQFPTDMLQGGDPSALFNPSLLNAAAALGAPNFGPPPIV